MDWSLVVDPFFVRRREWHLYNFILQVGQVMVYILHGALHFACISLGFGCKCLLYIHYTVCTFSPSAECRAGAKARVGTYLVHIRVRIYLHIYTCPGIQTWAWVRFFWCVRIDTNLFNCRSDSMDYSIVVLSTSVCRYTYALYTQICKYLVRQVYT